MQQHPICIGTESTQLTSVFVLASGKIKQWAQTKMGAYGLWAAALLGIVFDMSLCPTTAALFFGSLTP